MDDELLRRAEDLSRRAGRTGSVTHPGFLTPAEAETLRLWAPRGCDCVTVFEGGRAEAERRCCFFLPDWMDPEDFDPSDELRAIELTVRFGAPGHRDVLGAALALGIEREWLGDILIDGERVWLFCLPSVERHLLDGLDHVGRWGAKTRAVPLSEVPAPKRELRPVRFTVRSPRLDAVISGIFRVSRGTAAEAISEGLVQRNYLPCLKPDAQVQPGDVLSLRGKGKARVLDTDAGESRSGRQFIDAEIYQ